MHPYEKPLPSLPLPLQLRETSSRDGGTTHPPRSLAILGEENRRLRKEVESLRHIVIEQDSQIKALQDQVGRDSQQKNRHAEQAAILFKSIRAAVEAYRDATSSQESTAPDPFAALCAFSDSDEEWV
ncbi:hypothetical protein B0T10DRAFT_572143 [Thelonectria olida]|uniref:Uncharacterized protein n=1 Tax=Thelonectria olida TaxID=1576542 RepID=A0A9P9APP8_9HYPO|nr:hypothetical protein B0T10DRAFT_572143 [Thelonectria olida]